MNTTKEKVIIGKQKDGNLGIKMCIFVLFFVIGNTLEMCDNWGFFLATKWHKYLLFGD